MHDTESSIELFCFFPCGSHYSESAVLRVSKGRGVTLEPVRAKQAQTGWVVRKLRYVGEPVEKLCEANYLHEGEDRHRFSDAQVVWQSLPGSSVWADFGSLASGSGSNRLLSGKQVEVMARNAGLRGQQQCKGPQLLPPHGPCAPILFVGRRVTDITAENTSISDALLDRAHQDEVRWWKRAAASVDNRQHVSATATRSTTAVCRGENGTGKTPRIYTAMGLRAALASGTCSNEH